MFIRLRLLLSRDASPLPKIRFANLDPPSGGGWEERQRYLVLLPQPLRQRDADEIRYRIAQYAEHDAGRDEAVPAFAGGHGCRRGGADGDGVGNDEGFGE